MKRYDVITIGGATRDIFVQSRSFQPLTRRHALHITLDGKMDVDAILLSTGGGATNAAATFAQLSLRTAFVGRVGDDEHGRAVLRDLTSRGIAVQWVVRDERPTPISVILSVPGRGRSIFTHRAPTIGLDRRRMPFRAVRASWHYVTSLGGDLKLLSWILRQARSSRTLVACNPGADELRQRQSRSVLARATALILNREEANLLARTNNLSFEDVAARIRVFYRGVLAITDGARGAAVVAGNTVYRAGTHRNLRVVEWTGAGDAFGSGFVAGLLCSNGDPVVGLQVGTANAESVIQRLGAKNGLLEALPPRASRIAVTRSTV